MTDLSELERSSLTMFRIVVDLMAADILALRSEVKRLKDEGTPPMHTTPSEGSAPREGTSEPVAWHVKGCEYDTGCEFEYATLDRGQAEAAASEQCKVVPLYREPVAAWRLVHENERLRDEVARLRLTDEERTEVSRLIEDYEQDGEPGSERCVSTLRGLLERTK